MIGRNKYGAQPATLDGRRFASTAERDYAAELHLRQRAGEIADLREQHQVALTDARIAYRPDFSFLERGRRIFVDVKGVETPRFKVIAALWSVYGPGPLRIVKRQRRAFVIAREILPRRVGPVA